jgi:SAM-dependent methyltransferase
VIAEFDDPRLVAVYETVNEYDLGTQPDFCRELAIEIDATTIVDVGCGTGLITRELARLGYRMIGVDPAPAMLEIARRRPFADRVRWLNGDASLVGDAGADLAIMTGHVAQFFLTDEAWHANLVALHRALQPGGVLAFESRNPEARAWERWTRDVVRSVDDPEAGRIDTKTVFLGIDHDVVWFKNDYFFAATGELVVSSAKLRFRTHAELSRTLTDAGFTVEHVYGDWGRQPLGPHSPELIFVARRN